MVCDDAVYERVISSLCDVFDRVCTTPDPQLFPHLKNSLFANEQWWQLEHVNFDSLVSSIYTLAKQEGIDISSIRRALDRPVVYVRCDKPELMQPLLEQFKFTQAHDDYCDRYNLY